MKGTPSDISSSLLSTTWTKPTGIATTREGRSPSSTIIRLSSISAIGAFPMTAIAPSRKRLRLLDGVERAGKAGPPGLARHVLVGDMADDALPPVESADAPEAGEGNPRADHVRVGDRSTGRPAGP